ncbi:MAG: excinuclease ABC subunit C [Candidatus Buchananbacteria bacterium RIFCSPLOWO2_02_FULL_46_11b]|uniref:Excinuclease ABC subunit C n=2 Tax=Candidatus Buchananiibacteriota TaxID=1817903 RepID=A0A1G1YN82_9BACT|nr:MAG: excinuclease ABC subunit C [Candidatus Buchananbacteria bacterium RIFCSPLOWO2_01_FULL_45_31]OGY57211.1 MAG: excinuclease ABC subunit C [Candidatus Buchananbacteria bacterium RIFCSPLOWO2_02_FULL_46_11b]
MLYVYFLRSKNIKNWVYVGSTNNLKRRFEEHLSGKSLSTKPFLPVYLDAYLAVRTESKARMLEKYFKTGSGKAILKKRILSDEAD